MRVKPVNIPLNDKDVFTRVHIPRKLDPKLDDVTNIHAGKTAWILGSGVTLDETVDCEIPEDTITIALNGGVVWFWNTDKKIPYSGVAPLSLYRRRLDYWFCFDRRVSNPNQLPDYDYYNLAMRHPTAIKMLPTGNRINRVKSKSVMKNVKRFELSKKNTKFNRKYDGTLITGDSIITPALHYCYMAGFKRVLLTGVDLCCLADYDRRHRYSKMLRDMKWRGRHIRSFKHKTQAPNGETVRVNAMYKNQWAAVMGQIRLLQREGIEVYKTSERGMLDIPVAVV